MTRQIIILAGRGMTTEAIKRLLEEETSLSCQIVEEQFPPFFPSICPADLVLILSEDWQQLRRWLLPLHQSCPSCPWLIQGDYRLSGMFLSSLDPHPCALISPHSGMVEVRSIIELLIEGLATPPVTQLMSQFASRAMIYSRSKPVSLPTIREFEIGCAVSLRLTNLQIAQALSISEATINSHLNHLYQKLRLSHRRELATYFEMALSDEDRPH